jgi:hypothetical protein
LSSLSAEASQNATVAFMLVPGPGNQNAGQLARLSVVLDGMFV